MLAQSAKAEGSGYATNLLEAPQPARVTGCVRISGAQGCDSRIDLAQGVALRTGRNGVTPGRTSWRAR
jgi:hypothetical protein